VEKTTVHEVSMKSKEVSEGFAEVVQEGTGACVGGCEIGGSLVSGLGLVAAFTREL
jgi:hypothetical protein